MKKHMPLLILYSTFGLAIFSMLTNSLGVNPQPDAQLMRYAWELLESVSDGPFDTFYFAVRKYPLVPVVILDLIYAPTVGLLILTGKIESLQDLPAYLFAEPVAINFVGRLFPLAATILTLVLVARISKKLFPKISSFYAVVLLMSSLTFLTFATAVRPHIFVAFFTILTFYCSFQLYEKRTFRRELYTFGSALLAFCSLQNGLFAFMFPLIAMKKRRVFRSMRWVILCLIIALFIGYPFALNSGATFGLDLGHNQGILWNGGGFKSLGLGLLGSDLLLAIFGLIGFIGAVRTRGRGQMVSAMLLYFAAYIFVFGLNAGSAMRFFIPILPFLAILGGPVLARSGKTISVVLVLVVMMHLKFAYLGFKPDTYELASNFVQAETSGVIASEAPSYFLGIPKTKDSIDAPNGAREVYIKNLEEDLSGSRDFVELDKWEDADVVVAVGPEEKNYQNTLCFEAGEMVHPAGFLWENPDFSLKWLIRMKNMGPKIRVFCKE